MLWILCLFALNACVFLSAAEDIHPQCKTSKVQLVLRCHHNDSGTWQSKLIIKHDAKDSEGTKNPPWTVDVKQAAHVCEEGQSTLETVIDLETPGVSTIPTKVVGSEVLEPTREENNNKKVPEGYELFPGIGYYKFHHDVSNWTDAKGKCEKEGGHLVIINSEAEREVVRKLFVERNPNSPGSSQSEQIHTGIRRTDEGRHVTVFGTPLENTGFSTWFPGQPSSGSGEPCVSIMSPTITLNDITCHKQILAFICELVLYDEIPHIGFYKGYITTATRNVAQARCLSEGGYLANFETAPETDALVTYAKSQGMPDWIMTGITDAEREGVFKTSTGVAMNFQNTGLTWRAGEPDNYNNEDCLQLQTSTKQLGDVPCDTTFRAYICKRDY